MAIKKGTLTPKAYARIYTVMGEELIRNEKIALIEIIKNSYDADAGWVQIRFENFYQKDQKDNKLIRTKDSYIEIEDSGIGMTFDIIKDSWLNPAAPYKLFKRRQGKDKTKKGRIIQGEKGIGRYALFKIGSTVELTTKASGKNKNEIFIKCDLSKFDNDLLTKRGKKQSPIFLDDIRYEYEIRDKPKDIIQKDITLLNSIVKRHGHGTLIRITHLKSDWTLKKIQDIYNDCLKLISPFNKIEFNVHIQVNKDTIYSSEDEDLLNNLLEIAPLKITGNIKNDGSCKYTFKGKTTQLTLQEMSANRDVKNHFFDTGKLIRTPECGPFQFQFYVFDRRSSNPLQILSKRERDLMKDHRIYLYRDGIRVYPYGDPNDDWLELDVLRGTQRWGDYLGNDQTVGYINITAKDNPTLKDKSNREGLMDIGNAFEDFRVMIYWVLGFLHGEFTKLKDEKPKKKHRKKVKKGLFIKEQKVEKDLQILLTHFEENKDESGKKIHSKIEKNIKEERKILNTRSEIVEDLAAVGMTVDAASHDLMIMMGRSNETLNGLIKSVERDNLDVDELLQSLEKLRGQFAFMEDQLSGIQPLFRSSRRGSKSHRISEIIDNVKIYYSVPIDKMKIDISIEENGPPLVIKCPEAILLQVFINLIDNSVHWLPTVKNKNKMINVIIDGDSLTVLFSDNGPGVRKGDINYIFEPFFTTKGVRGRGLGLYIARQLLERHDFDIDYIEKEKEKALVGANFLIDFSGEE